MKSFSAFLVAAAALSTVHAQAQVPDDTSMLSDCEKTCHNNMMQKAAEFKCNEADIACLCQQQDFLYGHRDCAETACGQPGPINAYIEKSCLDHGVSIHPLDGSRPEATPTADNGNSNGGDGDGSETSNPGGVDGGAGVTVTTVDENGSTYTSTLATTATEALPSDGDTASETTSAAGETPTDTDNGDTDNGDTNNDDTDGGDTDEETPDATETSTGGTAQKTAAPVGMLAAAGIVAFLV